MHFICEFFPSFLSHLKIHKWWFPLSESEVKQKFVVQRNFDNNNIVRPS